MANRMLDLMPMAGTSYLSGAQTGLLSSLGNSLAPPPAPDPNDPQSLRAAAVEASRRGDHAAAQQYDLQASRIERDKMAREQMIQQNTDRTLARGDRRMARVDAMNQRNDEAMAQMQQQEAFKARKANMIKALKAKGRDDLVMLVESAGDQAGLNGLMGSISSSLKDPSSSWTKVELEDGVYAVDESDPSKKVRLGDAPVKPTKAGKGEEVDIYETGGASAVQMENIATAYDPLFKSFADIDETDVKPLEYWLTSWYPGGEAKTVEAALKNIKSNVAFDRLQKMRDESKTGGALGQVSNIELSLLESTLGTLDPTSAKFKESLKEIQGVYRRTLALDMLQAQYGSNNIVELKRTKDGQGYAAKLSDGRYVRYP